MAILRLTAADATVRFLAAQHTEIGGRAVPVFGGAWAIFGHGNVAGLGPALHAHRDVLPTFRAHNEQAMAHAAIAYAKTYARRRMMACTSSVGPGATNMVTAAAVAHVNRLPVLFLPGDVFASRRPDPVLQQVEAFGDATVSANDCFRPVSRLFDRIMRAEQLLAALPAAMRVLTDPVECGPVTLAFPQDVQTEALDWPEAFFRVRMWRPRAPEPDAAELREAAGAIRAAQRPVLIAGGGVKYAGAEAALRLFAETHGVPVAETQAGKGSLRWDDPANAGAIGVTGSAAANGLAAEADLVIAVGTRLQDFTTGSRALFGGARLVGLNVAAFDAHKHGALPLVADAGRGLAALSGALAGWAAPDAWRQQARDAAAEWRRVVDRVTAAPRADALPTDAQVLGAVNRAMPERGIVVCAAGGLPGELHKLWRATDATSYHLEYGYSCMGYEIAGGLGAKLAAPDREVVVLVGDGSYLMMNSELATSVALGAKLVIVVLDNRGFGCISRLQRATGGEAFNNLLEDAAAPQVDFAAHARALGAEAMEVDGIAALEAALPGAFAAKRTQVIVVETDPASGTAEGGAWWEVPVSAAPATPAQEAARREYEKERARREVLPALRAAPSPHPSPARGEGEKVRLGINPLSWTNDDMPELGAETPLETCLAEAKLAGFAGVELGNKFPREAGALRPVLARHGLDLVSGWYGSRLLDRDVEAEMAAAEPHIALLAALGCTVMVHAEVSRAVHGDRTTKLSRRPVLSEADWPVLAPRMTEFGTRLRARGLRLAYHHHMGTVIEAEAEVDRLMAETGPEVGLLLDTGHLTFAGGNPVRAAGRHAARVVHVHCKDVRAEAMRDAKARDLPFLSAVLDGVFTVPGDGCVDYPRVLKPLAEAGYAGWLVVEAEQDPAKAHPLTYARMGHDNLARYARDAFG